MVTVRATTTPGLEDIAVAEGMQLLQAAGLAVTATEGPAFGLPGVVTWDMIPLHDNAEGSPVERDEVWNALRRARSLYHVITHREELSWDGATLESLLGAVRRTEMPELAPARSFRASCTRIGEHGFHSPDVEREVGSIVQERYGTPVDLVGYEINVRIDVIGERAFLGYQLTGRKGLDRRYTWKYHPRVTLRTPVAYGLLTLSGFVSRPGRLHDPFCGSGTILLEAASLKPEPESGSSSVTGSDWDERAVSGARSNLWAAGFDEVAVWQSDARDLGDRIPPGSLDYIVTNPPFGIRLGRSANFRGLYDAFLRQAAIVLKPSGVLAMLVGKRRGVFNRVLRGRVEFALSHVRVIEIGGVYPAAFVLRRTGA
jgi:tRNA (guanine6-N2)-methyltransferase